MSHKTFVLFAHLILLILIGTQSFAQIYSDLTGPVQATVSASRLSKNSVRFTVTCTSDGKFVDGFVSLSINIYKSKHIDSVLLWKGDSDTEQFKRAFDYTINLPERKKAYVNAIFSSRDSGSNKIVKLEREYYVYNYPDTLFQTAVSYSYLEGLEVDYLIKKRGFENMTIEEINAIDPRFAKWIKKVLGVHTGKIYKER